MKVNQSIWHCKRIGEDENGIITYAEPKEYKLAFNYLTVNPASGYLATIQYGEQLNKIWTMKANKQQFENVFNEGDVLYIEGAAPYTVDENYVYGYGANALVTSLLPYLTSYTITLERIQP